MSEISKVIRPETDEDYSYNDMVAEKVAALADRLADLHSEGHLTAEDYELLLGYISAGSGVYFDFNQEETE